MTIEELMNKISFHPDVEITFSMEGDYVKIKVTKCRGVVVCCSNKVIDKSDLPFVESCIQLMIEEVENMAAKNA